ncbi:MAG: ISNCY family transposase, partial [Roseiarcus sp.]
MTSLDGYAWIALDGTQYFCSNKLSCQNCSTRKHANGQIDYFHTVVAASVVKPSKNCVLSLRPEFIEPQQGYDKQDCESRAARRWLALNASRY